MIEGLGTFLAEAAELSTEIERALLAFETGAASKDDVDALFRAMHTIKGSAGLFGLDDVVEFAHVVETVLDRVRAGRLAMSKDLVAVLIDCRDHLDQLIAGATPGASQDEALAARGAELRARLETLGGEVAERQPAAPSAMLSSEPGLQPAQVEHWHISLRLMPEMLAHGMDPISILRYLNTFGHIAAIELLDDALPPLNEYDPEQCYIGFELRYATQANRERIESAFEYVREGCVLTILPPRTLVADYVRLIRELPESESRLGEILVRCGSLTSAELQQALAAQSASAGVEGRPQPLGEILIERGVVAPAVVEAAVEKQRQAVDARTRERTSLRVDAEKIEQLIDVVGELVTASAATDLLARRSSSSALSESTHRLARLVQDVRDRALKLRMMPIGTTFARFARLVRDTGREMGKDIRLEIVGEETELDKTLIEKITDPLTHLVRNAIDHGIEAAEVRVAASKPAAGTVRLSASHDAGAVVIEVADDGGGLKRERIRAKAIERGLISADAQLADAELCALIFEPGFSTAPAVTDLSGRGVGMDVVKRNIAAMRGTVTIDSREGAGTAIRIRLPLTLAIIEGFLVRVGAAAFVLPLDAVEECVESSAAATLLEGEHQFIDLRGEILPIVRLRAHFMLAATAPRRPSIVVARSAGRRVGFVVDELLGEHQTVIKPLSRVLHQVRGLSGSTILADGEIALIIDVPTLLDDCQAQSRHAAETGGFAAMHAGHGVPTFTETHH